MKLDPVIKIEANPIFMKHKVYKSLFFIEYRKADSEDKQ